MHIIHIAAEMAPIAKVGGLGDVILGLSRESILQGHQVSVILPKYDCMKLDFIFDLRVLFENFQSWYEGNWHNNTIWTATLDNIQLFLIDPHHARNFFNRGCCYGCIAAIERFNYFSRCCLDFFESTRCWPEIIHLHDWQSAAISLMYKDIFSLSSTKKSKVVMTIHNISYQGLCSPLDLKHIGLDSKNYLTPELIQDTLYPEAGNLLKGSILYSDFITTVSPSYSEEVLLPEFGMGLESVLAQNKHKFQGILNGIDYVYWNPETDPYIPINFSANQTATPFENKDLVKKVLRERLTMFQSDKPLVACIARLIPQKGIELIKHVIHHADDLNIQFVLLGVCPIPEINEELHRIKKSYEENLNIHINLYHRDELAHMIYAASDMFIIPSIFEPCGLTQMIALRYGSIPIVRKTGGLKDTICDIDYGTRELNLRNGYTFTDPSPSGLDCALKRAISCWSTQPEKWKKLCLNGMNLDFSWKESTKKYLRIYDKLTYSS